MEGGSALPTVGKSWYNVRYETPSKVPSRMVKSNYGEKRGICPPVVIKTPSTCRNG
jgi:hypothetical protein